MLLTSTQLLLLKKEKKLRDILLSETANSANLITSEPSNSEIISSLAELSRKPVKIIDKKTAENRICQWQKQESQCESLMVAAESYNLFHLMSLVEIYDDLMKVGKNLSKDPKNNIKSVKKWVIKFMISVLNINNKAEQCN